LDSPGKFQSMETENRK